MNTPAYPSKNRNDQSQPLVVGLGELLWDIFPDSQRMGGAPANFAIHCQQLGAIAAPVSRVGSDELGDKTIADLKSMHVDTTYVSRAKNKSTGTVRVQLDAQGKPSYQIAEEVAWDFIEYTSELENLAKRADAVCFGSLGQRSSTSRATIRAFVEATPPTALRIFDVNLRQNYFSRELVEQSLTIANVLKVSDEELPVLADYFKLRGSPDAQLDALRALFNLKLIAYTRGPDGSRIITAIEQSDFAGIDGDVLDSVGAGDSFTAALCMGLLQGWPLDRVNHFANEVATFVCSQKGATPSLPTSLLEKIQ